jgi:hypothetical protein
LTDKTLLKIQADLTKQYGDTYFVITKKAVETVVNLYESKLVTLKLGTPETQAQRAMDLRFVLVDMGILPEEEVSKIVRRAELQAEKARRAR